MEGMNSKNLVFDVVSSWKVDFLVMEFFASQMHGFESRGDFMGFFNVIIVGGDSLSIVHVFFFYCVCEYVCIVK
jgi:hypothetical protein